LQVELVGIAQLVARVHLLLENSQIIPNHDDFVEEGLERDFFRLKRTFRRLHDKNIEIKEGLGLLDNAIIDQHFIVRSRYNRLLSALAKYPALPCIGIDEVTAIVVHGNRVKVTGESQVFVFKDPRGLKITSDELIKLTDMQVSIYTKGDEFLLK